MEIKTVINWLESIYKEHGNVKVTINDKPIDDLEDTIRINCDLLPFEMPTVNIESEEI